MSIASARVNKPDILFADEPGANHDSENSKIVLELFKEINEDMQQTVMRVSHDGGYKDIFHRIIQLKYGNFISDGTEKTSGH